MFYYSPKMVSNQLLEILLVDYYKKSSFLVLLFIKSGIITSFSGSFFSSKPGIIISFSVSYFPSKPGIITSSSGSVSILNPGTNWIIFYYIFFNTFLLVFRCVCSFSWYLLQIQEKHYFRSVSIVVFLGIPLLFFTGSYCPSFW